ncbi:MAG: AEC family transporter [Burkholderiales bacterium]|nr:AEC family transporter [Burkholderiales bacterium]
MPVALLLVPDFLLIAAGWFICRHTVLDRPVWDGAERLVYHVLFPALLFEAIVRNPLQPGAAAPLAAAAFGLTAVGVVLALALGAWPGVDARAHASAAQTAFRFNSYIALALAARLGGAEALAGMALAISVCVPLCNVAAVWPLTRLAGRGGHGYLRELARNPLIIATVAGLACNALGLRLPEWLAITLSRMGAAALPLGLMAVGAGLTLGALREAPRLAAALLTIRHAVLPALALALVLAAGFAPAQQSLLVTFASLPTASSAYVLAVRLGGHGAYVAGMVTVSTLLAMLGLPLSLSALAWLRG